MKLYSQCCKDCKKRHPKCHSECEEYLAAKEENERIRKARKEAGLVIEYIAESVRKSKRKRK